MDETTKRELDALLTIIKDTANRCVKVSRLFRKSTEGTIDSAASVPTSNPQEILKYERGLDIESIKSSYKYLDISEYLRGLSDYYDTLDQYFTKVMPVHWFLLYITHRFHLSNWRSDNKAILASSSNTLSLKEIDRYLFKYLCEYDYNGIGYVKEIMSFAAKAIDDRIPADIADIYFHSNHPEDDSNRLTELKELLKDLPGHKSVALAEIFDCIIYLTESEPYRLLNPSLKFFLSDVYLDISEAGFSSDYCIIESKKPAILPRQFKTVDDWLAGIKEEYVINRGIIDEGVCIYIDDLLGIEHTHRDAATADGGNNQINESNSEEPSIFSLPEYFFNMGMDRNRENQHFRPKAILVSGGAEKFCYLINYLASEGFISSDIRTKRLFAYILTGRWKPDDYRPGETINWMEENASELCYIIKHLTIQTKGKYDVMKAVFSGNIKWDDSKDQKEVAKSANVSFQQVLHGLYPCCPIPKRKFKKNELNRH